PERGAVAPDVLPFWGADQGGLPHRMESRNNFYSLEGAHHETGSVTQRDAHARSPATKIGECPKIEAYRRLNKEGKKISWPTFLGILQCRRGAECRNFTRELRKTEGL
ncbi:MAG TPA: hypothetical protein PK533_05465, partial [Rectinema sp.]|nr:hypothetical protein [Rectinema sp.]